MIIYAQINKRSSPLWPQLVKLSLQNNRVVVTYSATDPLGEELSIFTEERKGKYSLTQFNDLVREALKLGYLEVGLSLESGRVTVPVVDEKLLLEFLDILIKPKPEEEE